jgi:hypothetical protein
VANSDEKWIEAGAVGVVGQIERPAVVDFLVCHDVPPVSFSFDI